MDTHTVLFNAHTICNCINNSLSQLDNIYVTRYLSDKCIIHKHSEFVRNFTLLIKIVTSHNIPFFVQELTN